MCTLACGDFLTAFFDEVELLPLVAVVFASLIGLVGIIGGLTAGIMKTRAKEQTKRELAAYVAEGTLDADKAVAMLNAGMPKWEIPDFNKKT